MSILRFLMSLLCLASGLSAADTAYVALQDLAKQGGTKKLGDVMLLRGEGGDPQPQEWIVFRGPMNARTYQGYGIRTGGGILGAKVPAATLGLEPHAQQIEFSMLSLDSHGAWQIAKREARKENFRFGRVDYELKTNPMAGVPAWSLRLYNEKKHYLGELTLSAATGEVLSPLRLRKFTVVEENGVPVLVTKPEPWPRRAGRSVGRWFSQTGTAFGRDLLRAAGTAEEIVIGRRTRDFSEDVN